LAAVILHLLVPRLESARLDQQEPVERAGC
jgi:hypothetical protein